MPDGFTPHAPGSAKCNANKASGGLCQNPAGYGTTHPGYGRCKWHFGNTKAHRELGAKSMIRGEAYKIMEARGIDPDSVTPHEVFRDELLRSHAVVAYLEENSTPESLMWPDWQAVFLNERKHLIATAKMMIDAGIAEREVKILQAQAMLAGRAVRRVLDGLGLTDEQMALAPSLMGRAFADLEDEAIEVSAIEAG